MSRGFGWAVVLLGLVSFALSIVSILVIRSTWADPDRREAGIIWLYLTTVFIFVTSLFAAIQAELTPLYPISNHID